MMNIIRIIKALFMATAMFSYSVYSISLIELQNTLGQYETVRADFIQERHLSGMDKPLIAKGKVLISNKKGVIWQQISPIEMITVLESEKMTQYSPGMDKQVLTAQSQPQLFQINHLLRDLIVANNQTLNENFEVELVEHADDFNSKSWTLSLIPKQAPLNALFSKIELQGQDYINLIILNDKQGDMTKIIFSKQADLPIELTDAEELYFVP